MNDKLKYIVTSIFLSSLFAVLYTGCKQDSIEINALPFQENEGDNWGLISTSGKIEIPSGSFTLANRQLWSMECSVCRTKKDIINSTN